MTSSSHTSRQHLMPDDDKSWEEERVPTQEEITNFRAPKGAHVDRLTDRKFNNREISFFEQWQFENGFRDVAANLLQQSCKSDDPDCVGYHPGTVFGYKWAPGGAPTERDRMIMSTLIQWLGSNVGFAFIQSSLDKAGYTVVQK